MSSKTGTNLAWTALVVVSGVLGYHLPFAIGLEAYGYVIKEEVYFGADDPKMRAQALISTAATIEIYQRRFSGTKSETGCFVLDFDSLQETITYFQFTAEELGQTAEELKCHGFLVPADPKPEDDA